MIDLERYDEWGHLDTAQLIPAYARHHYLEPAAIERVAESSRLLPGHRIEALEEHAGYMENLREKLADELEVHGLLARDLSKRAIQRGHTVDCQTATAIAGDSCSCGLAALIARMDNVLRPTHGSELAEQSSSS